MRSLSRSLPVFVTLILITVVASPRGANAQTFKIESFNGADGADPQGVSLIQGTDGNLYGTTQSGGANDHGTVFKVSPSGGKPTTLYNFCSLPQCADGSAPLAGLVLATDGNLYGTTYGGGANNEGTVFAITLTGTLTTLFSFCPQSDCAEGSNPFAALIQATDGNLYGAAVGGGSFGWGTVFKITTSGTLTMLHSFDVTDGSLPNSALVQGTDGNFYGTTYEGGSATTFPACPDPEGCGTVFRMSPTGAVTTLHSFSGADGIGPVAGLIQATDGNFYGTTEYGGGSTACNPNNPGCGTLFKITPGGTVTTLHIFGSTDGAYPYAGLVQGTDGDFYGTTVGGGANNTCEDGCGTVFRIRGTALTTLHSFGGSEGSTPFNGLVQDTDGNFYGLTGAGGNSTCQSGCGTVFQMSVGLGPFVSFVRSSANVGDYVGILGQGLTGTTSVSFNGTPASYIVVSDTFVTPTVPGGATTGFVTVTTPSGTLTSNTQFRVAP